MNIAIFSKYREIFGRPKEGIHRFRFMGIAIVDFIMTVAGAIFLSWFFNWPLLYCLAAVFFVAILVHRLFGVRTTIDKLLFPAAGDA